MLLKVMVMMEMEMVLVVMEVVVVSEREGDTRMQRKNLETKKVCV